MQQYVCKLKPHECGCRMTASMAWALRELQKRSAPERVYLSPHDFAKLDHDRRTHNAMRMILRTLAKRRYVMPNGWDRYRIANAGELWCEEHPG